MAPYTEIGEGRYKVTTRLATQNASALVTFTFRLMESMEETRLVFSPLVRFLKFYLLRQGFRDGLPGLIHIAIGCFNSFIKYAKMRELHLAGRGTKKGDGG